MRGVLALTLCLVLAMGCRKTQPVSAEDYAATPHLPSPRAGTYARVPTEAPDPVVRTLSQGHQWDASLSGAAAGLALDVLHRDRAITPWRVRESSWRAGYPYPVSRVRAWSTPPGAPPPEELATWLDALPVDADLGLVRGRNERMDVWIGLMAVPKINIGVLPRQVSLGGQIELPALSGCSYAVADPEGRLFEGALELSQKFHLDVPGEWLLRVDDEQGVVALFPIYAGMVPPDTTLFDDADLTATGDLSDRIERVLASVRELYGAEVWQRDARLDAAADSLLTDNSPSTDVIAGSLGYDSAHFSRWGCVGSSLEECLDRVIWDPRARPGLLGQTSYLGLAAEVSAGEVRIIALVAPR